jgi:hypothetical protein
MQNIILTIEEFNKRLFELLCDKNDDIDDEEVCLISGNKLEKDHITLICSIVLSINVYLMKLRGRQIYQI